VLSVCNLGVYLDTYHTHHSCPSFSFYPFFSQPAVVIHELGHNFNLAHSGGLNGATYTDHTCLMGNPLFQDDVAHDHHTNSIASSLHH
jgi:hypothetical protein